MTADRPDYEGMIRGAIANVAGAHVFLEDRTDVRVHLASSGLREIAETRTRGAVISGRRSIHVTEPEFMPTAVSRPESASAWWPRLEAQIVDGATRASSGRRHPLWSAKLVAFHQDVWVGSSGEGVSHDARQGRRVELRVRIGGARTAQAVEELVLRSVRAPTVADAFVRAFDRAEQRLSGSVAAEPGTTAAVFAPGAAGVVVHELIGHALEGDVVSRGPTWIRDAMTPTAGAPVTVIDDPRRGRGSWLIDDEGVATDETVLIDRGRAVGVLLDQASASALGRTSTGHGRRSSYLEAVLPRMGCTFIAAGADASADILRATSSGVFIRRLAGGHTDPLSGRASFVVSDADRIVSGRLAEPLDPFVLELDGAESWVSIDRVAHDLAFDTCVGSCLRDGQPIAVSVGAPTIRIGVARVRS